MHDIKESDWKHLRQLKAIALDRFCSRALAEIQAASSDPEKTSHQRYQAVYKLVEDRDDELANIFDDLKRSNAMGKLFQMRRASLLTDDEWIGFSDEIRSVFAKICNI
jgi:hypothetical protein